MLIARVTLIYTDGYQYKYSICVKYFRYQSHWNWPSFFFISSKSSIFLHMLRLSLPSRPTILRESDSNHLFPHFPSRSSPLLERSFSFIIHVFLHRQPIIIPEWESRRACDKKMVKKLLPKPKSKKEEAASSALPTLDRLYEVFTTFSGLILLFVYPIFDLYFLCLCFLSSHILAVGVLQGSIRGCTVLRDLKLVFVGRKKRFRVSSESFVKYIKKGSKENPRYCASPKLIVKPIHLMWMCGFFNPVDFQKTRVEQ